MNGISGRLSRVTMIPESSLSNIALPTDTIKFLTKVGLPTNFKLMGAKFDALSDLPFSILWDTATRLEAAVDLQPHFEFFPEFIHRTTINETEYLWIGYANKEISICIKLGSGEIYLVTDPKYKRPSTQLSYEPQLVNLSITHYLSCIEVYIHAIGRLRELTRKAQAIDKQRQFNDTPSNAHRYMDIISSIKNAYGELKSELSAIDATCLSEGSYWLDFVSEV